MERLGKYFATDYVKLNSLPFLVAETERERERCVEFSDFQIRSKRVGCGKLDWLAFPWLLFGLVELNNSKWVAKGTSGNHTQLFSRMPTDQTN